LKMNTRKRAGKETGLEGPFPPYLRKETIRIPNNTIQVLHYDVELLDVDCNKLSETPRTRPLCCVQYSLLQFISLSSLLPALIWITTSSCPKPSRHSNKCGHISGVCYGASVRIFVPSRSRRIPPLERGELFSLDVCNPSCSLTCY
jgi:hypothetical protein